MVAYDGWPPRWLTPVADEQVEAGDGDYICKWTDAMCRITKDTVAGRVGQPIVLQGWQHQLVSQLLARRADGRLLHREALIGMPRKNGKSALGSALALFALLESGQGAEVYSCAGDREQARIVFGMAKRMVELEPELAAHVKPYRDVLEVPETGSIYRCLSAEAYCAVPETIVELPNGERAQVGDLQRGERIVGVDGTTLVDDHVSATGARPTSSCYRITTHRGREVVVTADHPMLVRERTYKVKDSHAWVPAAQLAVGDRVVVGLGWVDGYEGKPLAPNEAWALGAWVGDGCNTKFHFTNIDAPLIDGVREFMQSIGSDLRVESNGKNWRVTGAGKNQPSPGREWIRRHFGSTTAYDKRIPVDVMTGTPEDWAAFLAGYLDTDGCVPLPRPYLKWTSASRSLLDDCRALLARLGVNAILGTTRVVYRGEQRTYHELRVCGVGQLATLAEILPLRHPVKSERLQRTLAMPRAFTFRAWDTDRVVAVESVGDRETVALSVARTAAHVTNGLVSHNTKEGLSPTFVVFDEVHVQPNDDLWDVMTLGSGARLDPIVLGITTAGSRTDTMGRDTLCYRKYQYGQRVARGEIVDPSFFFAWWEPKLGDSADHRDRQVWIEANPGFGTIIDEEDFASTVMRTPEPEFRTKRTNVWVTTSSTAFPHGAWDACAKPRVVAEDIDVVLFFDGSWSGDSTAIVGATLEDQPHLFVVEVWEHENDFEWRVPIADVEERIREACREYQVREVACDPYRWQRSLQALQTEGFPIVEFPQTLPRLIPAWQSFYEAVLDKRLTHDGDPLMARHVDNMVLKRDPRGVRPVKESRASRRHIDLGICAMGAHAVAIGRRKGPTEIMGAWR